MANCPRCGKLAEATGKEFEFGVFEGKQYQCKSCHRYFNAFYRDDELKYTVPKAK